MRPKLLIVATVLALGVGLGSPCAAQVSTSGPRSTAIGVVNGNVVVQGPSNAKIDGIAKTLNAIKANGGLTASELASLIKVINESILPSLTSIKGDTEAINKKLDDLNDRLGIAASHPGTAKDVLRPFLKPAFDLSNASFDINEFLDADGKDEYRLVFTLSGNCELYVDAPRGTGFTVTYGIFSDRGTKIFTALQGTQPRPRPLPLSTGTYQFVMKAKRDAGQYAATISARCY